MNTLLLWIVVLAGPIIYLAVIFRHRLKADSYGAFHFADRTVSTTDYVDTTVMYAMQVAALTLFATWGFLYGVGALWVPLFWGVGYWLLAKLIEKGYIDNFLLQHDVGTIHQFLANKTHWRLLGVLAALISLMGIVGPAMYEAEFVGTTVARIYALEADSPLISGQLLFLFFIVIASIYILYGGFHAIVKTDSWQLAFGFCGFSLFTAFLLTEVADEGFIVSAISLTIAMLLSVGVLLWLGLQQYGSIRSTAKPLQFAFLVYGIALLVILGYWFLDGNVQDTFTSFWESQKFGQPLGLGFMSLISLLIANGLYQVVDVGQWQRLASARYSESDFGPIKSELVRSIRYVMVYSPVTWIMAILFGMTLKYLLPDLADPYDAVASFLIAYWQSMPVLVLIFVLSLVAIMLSTLDSLVAAITFTLHNDCLVAFQSKWRSIQFGRLVTILFLVLGLFFYIDLSGRVNNFADILYTCWAFQIALFPLVMVAIVRDRLSASGAFASLAMGIIGALLPLYISSLNPYEHAPALSLLGSGLTMLIFTAVGKKAAQA